MNQEIKQSVMLPLSQLEPNKGQIEGLPQNPRNIKKDKFKKLKQSIIDNPEMLSLRELLVYPHEDKYIVIGGNMRYEAMKALKYKQAPCKVIDKDATVEQLQAYTIKDNGGFGDWDWDMLGNEWDNKPLEDWGLDIPTVEKETKKANGGNVAGEIPFTEILNEEHNYIVLYFNDSVNWLQAQTIFDIKPVRLMATAEKEQSEKFKSRYGVGRVIDGMKAIEKLKSCFGNENNN